MGIARILTDSVLGKLERDQLSLTLVTHFPGLFIEFLPGGHTRVEGVRMYLDGLPMNQDMYEKLNPKDLAGVEYCPIASAPAQYRFVAVPIGDPGASRADTILLFWSK